jgi:hypothetical protein
LRVVGVLGAVIRHCDQTTVSETKSRMDLIFEGLCEATDEIFDIRRGASKKVHTSIERFAAPTGSRSVARLNQETRDDSKFAVRRVRISWGGGVHRWKITPS